jgi:polyferredoxin
MKAILRTIELWASENDDRVKLLIILVWAGFGAFVLISTLIAAWIMLPPNFTLF